MAAAPGIAGSRRPEAEGCFVCLDEFEVSFFLRINNTGGPVDVWAIEGVEYDELVEPPNGFHYLSRPIGAAQVSLYRRDVPKGEV
jgi:hypothetical protein